MDRRRFLVMLAAGLAGAAVAHGAEELPRRAAVRAAPAAAPPRPAAAEHPVQPAVNEVGLVPVQPPIGVVDALPGEGTALALTIDDGVSSDVVGAYLQLARDTGVRLTFFPNGCYSSWTEHADRLRPMVQSGQIALGNHTWSHPDLTALSDADVTDQIVRNRTFLRDTFDAGDTPFFRPPFGYHDARVDAIAAGEGHPTVAMWNGTLGDDRVISGQEIVGFARQWFAAQAIVIGHANHPAVTGVYGQLVDLIAQRGLRTVTLADVWATRASRVAGMATSTSAPVG